jgi:hypothetical protein
MLPIPRTEKLGPSKLKPSLDNRLMAYVAAASAAGVTTLTLTQSAAAEIVYTPADITVGSSYALDLNHDGVPDFTLETVPYDSGHGHDFVLALDVPGNAAQNYARPLPIGSRIGPERKFTTSTYYGGVWMGENFEYGSIRNSEGPWYNLTNQFLGVKFLIDGQFHYGWVRLTVHGAISGVITGYAYETVPNRMLRAGQRSESVANTSSVTPLDLPASKLPSLGLLATGAHGLAIWRREEAEQA